MKILLTLNKTYRGLPDTGHWYTFEPLRELGHEVVWYDTVSPHVKDYDKVIEAFKPDLIWCCFTGNRAITPYEPWDSVKRETATGRTKTFHWFTDDTWRFDAKPMGSNVACHGFTACSTPEPGYVEKYKDCGYENIFLATWHANSKFYSPKEYSKRENEMCFLGGMNPTRESFFRRVAQLDHVMSNEDIDKMLPIDLTRGLDTDEMFKFHSNTKIGINLSINHNDPDKKTQMKQRIFETAAGGGLIFTEYHEPIKEFFEEDKEMITFKTAEEFISKLRFLQKNQSIAEKIAQSGHKRFLAEHDSKIRLAKLLKQIEEV